MRPRRLILPALALVLLASVLPALADAPPVDTPPAEAAPAEAAPLFPESPLFTPAPKPAAPECHFCSSTFTTSPGGGAPSHWGHGATCLDAQNDARAQLSAFVNDQCFSLGDYGRCAFAVVFTCSCYQQNGQYVIDAYATYRCWVNFC